MNGSLIYQRELNKHNKSYLIQSIKDKFSVLYKTRPEKNPFNWINNEININVNDYNYIGPCVKCGNSDICFTKLGDGRRLNPYFCSGGCAYCYNLDI